jgi:outer membrane lipoprotein carrier protein
MKLLTLPLRFFATAIAVTLLFATAGHAAEKASLEAVLAGLKKGYASMEDLHADFSQKTYIATIKREEKGAGELFLKKKGGAARFRFNYTKPKQQIISNGRTVWYYLPDNKQVILTDTAKLFAGGNAMALSYLTGLGSLSDDFATKLLTETPDKNGNYQLELTPKKANQAVARLHLFVSAAAVEKAGNNPTGAAFFPLSASVLFDQLGNRTTIEYSNIRLNRGLADSRFTFKPPAGVEVIKQ